MWSLGADSWNPSRGGLSPSIPCATVAALAFETVGNLTAQVPRRFDLRPCAAALGVPLAPFTAKILAVAFLRIAKGGNVIAKPFHVLALLLLLCRANGRGFFFDLAALLGGKVAFLDLLPLGEGGLATWLNLAWP